MGSSGHRRRRYISGLRHRRRPRDRADVCLRMPVLDRRRRRRRARPLSRPVHRGGPGTVDLVRCGAAFLPILHRKPRVGPAGHPSQRRYSAGQPLPADAARDGTGACSRRSASLPDQASQSRTRGRRQAVNPRPREGNA